MKNLKQEDGKVMEWAPGANIASGAANLSGVTLGVAINDVLSGVVGQFLVEGIVTLPALNTATGVVGAIAYWDATNLRVTSTASGNTRCGTYASVKADGPTTADIKLNA